MGLKQARCYYHPDREAVTKCERCNRMICLEDKMTYRSFGGMDQADDIYTYCPVCFNELKQAQKKARPFILLIFVVFAIIIIGGFIIGTLFLLDMFNRMSSSIPSIIEVMDGLKSFIMDMLG